jgi:hypothetical protein
MILASMVWGGLLGLLVALLVPPIRLRRANHRHAAHARH